MAMNFVDQLAQRACGIPTLFDELKSDEGGPHIAWDDYPVITLHKLETAGRIDFRCGLRLLADAELAYGAEIHVRGLIELLANVAGITGFDQLPPDLRGASQRALCFELGVADKLMRTVDGIPERFNQGKDTRKGATRRWRELSDKHKASGCACSGRPWQEWSRHLDQTIETGKTIMPMLGRKPTDNQFEQYRHLHSTASGMAHLGLWDRFYREVSPGVTDIVPADDQWRGNLLGWLVHTYGTSCLWILQSQGCTRAEELMDEVKAILGEPELKRICEAVPV